MSDNTVLMNNAREAYPHVNPAIWAARYGPRLMDALQAAEREKENAEAVAETYKKVYMEDCESVAEWKHKTIVAGAERDALRSQLAKMKAVGDELAVSLESRLRDLGNDNGQYDTDLLRWRQVTEGIND